MGLAGCGMRIKWRRDMLRFEGGIGDRTGAIGIIF